MHKNHAIYFVPSLQRGLQALEVLAEERKPMSVMDIAKRLNITRSSMFRLSYTLLHLGFIEEVPDTKLLTLGSRVLGLGYAFLASQDLIELARPELERLRDRTMVASHLAVLDRRDVLYLACIQTRSAFLSARTVGSRLPAYATPMGWFLLSDLTSAELRTQFPERRFTPLTSQTPTSISELRARIAEAKQRGYAISRSGVSPGGSSIAAPIRNRTGATVGAIDISAPDSAFVLKNLETEYAPAVMESAERISALLGYVPHANRSTVQADAETRFTSTT